MNRIVPFVPWIACAAVVLWGAALHAAGITIVPRATATTAAQTPVAIGGPFDLVSAANGQQVTDAAFRGRHMLVFFGFANCPDVCPMGLLAISEALKQLPAGAAAKLAPVFITLDPERDSADTLKAYAEGFDPRIVALTGSRAAIDAAAKAYRVYHRKVDLPDSALGYTVDHSSIIYLMDGDGRYVTHYTHETPPDVMAGDLKRRLGG